MSTSRAIVCAVVLASTTLACQKSDDRPPLMVCKDDAGCLGPGGVVGGGGGRGDGGPRDAAVSDGGLEVRGTVVVLAEDLATPTAFTGATEIRAETPRGTFVTGNYTGSQFRLEGVASSPMTWFGVRPTAGTSAAMPTLLAVDTESGTDVELALVQWQTLDLIYSLISLPTTREPGRGHVIVFFVRDDASRAPLAGVSVDVQDAETVIYDNDGSFTDLTTATGNEGIAVLANIPAQRFPGSKHRLLWSGAAAGFEEILIAGDAVTFVGFRVTPVP